MPVLIVPNVSDIAQISGTNALYIVSDGGDTYEAGTGYTQIASGVTNDQIAPGHSFYEFQHSSGSFLFVDTIFDTADFTDGPVDVAPENGGVNRVIYTDHTTFPPGTTVTHSLAGADAAITYEGAGRRVVAAIAETAVAELLAAELWQRNPI